MNSNQAYLKRIAGSHNLLQASSLLASTVVGLALGFITNSLLTRILGKEIYGDYALIYNIFAFCQIVFNFGLSYTIARLTALSNDPQKVKGYYSAGLLLVLPLFLLMSISIATYVVVRQDDMHEGLTKALLISIPFAWIYLVITLNESYLPSVNKINALSLSRLIPKVLLLVALLIVYYVMHDVTLISILIVNYITYIISHLYVFLKIRSELRQIRRRIAEIIIGSKTFGFYIYLGSLIAAGSSSVSALLISYFDVNNIEVGYYTLATLIGSPLSMIPGIIATTQFKQFAQQPFIPPKVIYATFSVSFVALLILLFLSEFIISIVFGDDYLGAATILQYLSVGFVLYGIGDFFNRFLLAKGRGKELRNASLIVGVTLLAANVVFIYAYSGTGAAIARIFSGAIYTLTILYYYQKEIKKC